jgi:hypothetical protein
LAEEYIEKILDTFKAKVYIFVVDEPGKYIDNVVAQLDSCSHFGANSEKVLVFREFVETGRTPPNLGLR